MNHRRAAVLVSVLCVGACAKKSRFGDAAAPTSAAADESAEATYDGDAQPALEHEFGDANGAASFEELQARFEQLDVDLSAEGISGTDAAPLKTDATTDEVQEQGGVPSTDAQTRCQRICSLKDAICDVSERICSLAETHEDDTKYAEACARSQTRCEQASAACSSCGE